MNKKLISAMVLLITTICMLAGPVLAQEKIALVSLQKALNEVNEGKRIKSSLKKEYESKKVKIDDMKTELEKLSADIEKQQSILSPDALQDKRKTLQAKFMDLQNKAATFEKELKTKEAQNARRILTNLRDVVIELTTAEGYTLVLENSTETVLFSKSGEEITDKVISAYNKKNK